MSFENSNEEPDRYKRRQRLMAYVGIAAFATGISVTLGTLMGIDPAKHSSNSTPAVPQNTPETTAMISPDDSGNHFPVVFGACVGGLAVMGGVVLLRPAASRAHQYLTTALPEAQIPPGSDDYIDAKYRELVEPLRGNMPEECGW